MLFPAVSLETQYHSISHTLFCSNKPVNKMSPTAVGVRTVEWENITSRSAWKAKLHCYGQRQNWSCFLKKQLSMHFEVQPLFLLTGEILIQLIGQK